MIAFENEELTFQRVKISLVRSFWSWTKLFMHEGPLPLINIFLIGWVLEGVSVIFSILSSFVFCPWPNVLYSVICVSLDLS